MKDLTIIVDGNYLAHKCLHIVKGFDKSKYDENNKFLSKPKDISNFVIKMTTDLIYSLNSFPGHKRVILTKDSQSWRKNINILNQDQYKSSRKESDDINWPMFYYCFQEFTNLISNNSGICISTIENAEGDDLMYLWSEYITQKENPDSVIIFTGDGDLSQIANFDDNNYIVIYDTKMNSNKIVAKNGFKQWLTDKNTQIIDIFKDGDLIKLLKKDAIDILKEVTQNIPISEIDPNEVILYKILCGDKGDTVPSVWEWISNKTTMTKKRITNKHYVKAKNYIKENYNEIDIDQLIYNGSFRNKIRVLLQEQAKIAIPNDAFKDKLNTNATLIYLNRKMLPEKILIEFDENKEELYKKLKYTNINIDILKGTKYEIIKSHMTSDIFSMY